IQHIFQEYPQVKLGYVFGSQTTGKTGPLSDYDFAVYLEEKEAQKRFDLRLRLMSALAKELGTDKVDVLVLNDIKSPEIKYSIIKEGILLYDQEPYKVLLLPRILNEYFDFMHGLRKYGLTKA
ncbi:MAG TPA: nucleotidyltransferase domain-containing protein, partial [Candidatus Paceibacterota bacterium]